MKKTSEELNALSKPILDICFEIHSLYGPGILESFYEEVLCYELSKAGIPYEQQYGIYPTHDGIKMGLGYRIDVLVEDEIILEIKSVEALSEVHHKQLITYLKVANKRLGFLINFGSAHLKDGIHRKVNGF
ncbi:MAG: GxxExxY protein [Saprospiraceae bacterium]